MPYTDVGIINLGLGKYSSSRINSISPGRTPLEVRCTQYPQWKESELSKRRWVFATDLEYDLPQIAYEDGKRRPYVYELSSNVLRPIRESGATWRQSGRKIYSDVADLTIPIIENIPEADFDPLFVDVLACRVWMETLSLVKESDSGYDVAKDAYIDAVAVAAKNNAYVIGPEDVTSDDDAFPFLRGRGGF